MNTDLPPELDMFARILDGQPPQVREVFHYALALLLVENGKAARHSDGASSSGARSINASGSIFVSNAGELFSVVRPDVSEEALAHLREMAREALREDGRE